MREYNCLKYIVHRSQHKLHFTLD